MYATLPIITFKKIKSNQDDNAQIQLMMTNAHVKPGL